MSAEKYKGEKKSAQIRCRHTRNFKNPCPFRATLELVWVFDKKHPDFYDLSNFRVNERDPDRKSSYHTCAGYETIHPCSRRYIFKKSKYASKQ